MATLPAMPTPEEVCSVTGQEVSLHGPQSGGSAPTILLPFTPAGGSQTQRRPVGRRGLSRRQTSLDRIFSLDPPLEQKIKTQVRFYSNIFIGRPVKWLSFFHLCRNLSQLWGLQGTSVPCDLG